MNGNNAIAGNNYRLVLRLLGNLLLLEGCLLVIPLCVCLGYGESDWRAFAAAAAANLAAGGALVFSGRNVRSRLLFRREGYLLTSLAWVFFSAFGMMPFLLSAQPLTVPDAFFETMSGFTTTGATVITDVEAQSHGILFWRALMQWVGGLGIVLFILAVLPSLNQAGSLPMFNAEITGVTHDKLHPRIRQTARSLWTIYVSLTAMLFVLLWLGPMDCFDALCQAMSTLSTGGFSTRNAGISAWHSDYVAAVLSLFMLVGGINFILLYLFVHGNIKALFKNDVFRAYIMTVAVFILVICVAMGLCGTPCSVSDYLFKPVFLVSSAITSTGFSYGNYEAWGPLALGAILVMMIFGACAGSTTGGMKIDRILVMLKNVRVQVHRTLYPLHVKNISLNGSILSNENLRRVAAFTSVYLSLTTVATLVLCAFGVSVDDSFFACASSIGNNGLGYGITGAEGSYSLLPDTGKWILSALMLIGRLEIFTVVALFTRGFWHR